VGERLGAGPFVTKPHIGIGVYGLLLSTWGEPIHEPTGATFLGGEFEFTIVQVNFRLAALAQVDGPSRDDPWLLAGGIGWGF